MFKLFRLVQYLIIAVIVVGTFPPYSLTPPPDALDYPKIGDCAAVKIWVVTSPSTAEEQYVRYCLRGYVYWLVNQPTGYYLEKEGDPYTVFIWNRETVDAEFNNSQ